MPKDFQQTDTAAPLGTVAACTSFTAGNNMIARTAVDGGTAGTGTPAFGVTNPGATDHRLLYFELDPGEDVPTGDHIVPIRITTTNTDMTWDQLHLCYWNGTDFTTEGTLGSVTGIGHVLDTAQVETATITGASAGPTYASSHRLYYVLTFDGAGAHGSDNANYTPDQLITTPIVVAAGGIPIIMHHRKQMAGN